MRKNDPEQQFPWAAIAGAIFTVIIITVLLNFKATSDLVCARWIENPNFKDEGCLLNYISEFQTLITGFAAVCAALWTIREMRKTEERQHKRHQQIMTLSVQDEYIALGRLIVPYADNVNFAFRTLIDLRKRCPEPSSDRDEFILEEYLSVGDALGTIDKFLKSAALNHAERYFNGVLASELAMLKGQVEAGLKAVRRIENYYNSFPTHDEDAFFTGWVYGQEYEGEYGALIVWRAIAESIKHLSKIMWELGRIRSKLNALAESYPGLVEV